MRVGHVKCDLGVIMTEYLGRHPGAKWRLVLLGLSAPLIAIAVLFTWMDYTARREATITEVRLQSTRVNDQLEAFVQTVREASAIAAVQWVNQQSFAPTDPDQVAGQPIR